MNSAMKIPLAIAGGYVLGRRRKARLALLLCAWLAGKRLNVHPVRMGREAMTMAANNPAVGKLGGDVKQQLLAAGKKAAMATANSQMNRFADRLHARTEALTGGESGGGEAPDEDEGTPDRERPRRREERGSREGERPVSRDRARKAGAKAEGGRKPEGRKPGRPADRKSGAPGRKSASRDRATQGSGDS